MPDPNQVSGCINGIPGNEPVPGGAPAPPSAAVVAQRALDTVNIRVPQPHTSPPEHLFQITGLRTWFWMDRAQWHPVTARAELPGIWAEVTATPTKAAWTPGDGQNAVRCAGPGIRYHEGASEACTHLYENKGKFTIVVAVTYVVTWRASTGETGTEDPITLTTNLPIDVRERQPVTN